MTHTPIRSTRSVSIRAARKKTRAAAQHPSAFLLACAALAVSTSVFLHEWDPLRVGAHKQPPKTHHLPRRTRPNPRNARSPSTVYKLKFGRFPFDLEASRVMTSGETVQIAPTHGVTLEKIASHAMQTRHDDGVLQRPAMRPTATRRPVRGF